MYLDIALIAVFTLVFSCVAGYFGKSWLTGPILFIAFGYAIGPLGFDALSFNADASVLKTLAEMTLALVLFMDATGANLKTLARGSQIPTRMLLIGLPLTLVLGFALASLMFEQFSLLEAAILATILAPTDAALGQAVVKNIQVPESMRQSLNAESGLNDGICVPILLLFLALAGDASSHHQGWQLVAFLFAEEIGIGLLVGFSMAFAGAKLIHFCQEKSWLTQTWRQVSLASLAIGTFALAQHVGGSGFIAAFCGGLLFGHLLKTDKHPLLEAGEGIGDTFSLITWVLFGSAVVGYTYQYLTLDVVLYSLLSLTLIRMLPIFLSLLGSGISTEGKLFLGWFGPRGLASLVFVIMVMQEQLPNGTTIIHTVAFTIVLSIIAHGLSANFWAEGLGKRFKQ